MNPKAVKYPALNVAAATAELVKGILALYPQAQIIPRVVPLEDASFSTSLRHEHLSAGSRGNPDRAGD